MVIFWNTRFWQYMLHHKHLHLQTNEKERKPQSANSLHNQKARTFINDNKKKAIAIYQLLRLTISVPAHHSAPSRDYHTFQLQQRNQLYKSMEIHKKEKTKGFPIFCKDIVVPMNFQNNMARIVMDLHKKKQNNLKIQS